jgi:hypothetical protein
LVQPNLKLVEGIKINIKANITEIETKNQFKRSTKQKVDLKKSKTNKTLAELNKKENPN